MRIPEFTAEASLYRTSNNYTPGGCAIVPESSVILNSQTGKPRADRLALWIAKTETLAGQTRDVQLRVATPVAPKVAAADQHGRLMRMRCVGQDTLPARQLDSRRSDPICGLRVFSEGHAPARMSEMTAFSTEANSRLWST
jgi:hypothetical protein